MHTGYQIEDRGLARPARPYQPYDLSCSMEIQTIDRSETSKALGQVLNLQQHRGPSDIQPLTRAPTNWTKPNPGIR